MKNMENFSYLMGFSLFTDFKNNFSASYEECIKALNDKELKRYVNQSYLLRKADIQASLQTDYLLSEVLASLNSVYPKGF